MIFSSSGLLFPYFASQWLYLEQIVSAYVLFLCIRLHRPPRDLVPAVSVCAAVYLTYFLCLYDRHAVHSLQLVLCMYLLLTVYTAFLMWYAVRIRRWERGTISAASIKESLDTLPAGLCCIDRKGRVSLSNRQMNHLCLQLMGMPLENGTLFCSALRQGLVTEDCKVIQIGSQPILRTPDSRVFSFHFYDIDVGGSPFVEILAADITMQFERTALLQEKNAELESFNERLHTYSDTLSDVTRERERLNAKISIHDQMNRLLLSARNVLENNDTPEERDKLFRFWRANIRLYHKDRQVIRIDPLADLTEAAESIGIQLHFIGEMPADDKERVHVLMLATGECLTNAARHAGAKTLTITYDGDSAVFTNDGTPPDGPVREGGGLGTVRHSIEAIGGSMDVEYAPEFRLILYFTKKGAQP